MEFEFVQPIPKDQSEAVPLIYSSGPEIIEWLFTRNGKEAMGFMEYAFADGRGFFGHKSHMAVKSDGKVMGIGSFYNGAEHARMVKGLLAQVTHYYPLTAFPQLAVDLLALGKWMAKPTHDMTYVANLGVSPKLQGHGIGKALLEHEKLRAQTLGRKHYALDVASNNPRAEALYCRLGFNFVSESPFTGRDRDIQIPAARRLSQSLSTG